MLHEAAQIIQQAHQNGLVAILWIYLRGKAVLEERNPQLSAGAAGVAATLGADFVKIKSPEANVKLSTTEALQEVVTSAGKTKVLCAGGSKQDPADFLRELHGQLTQGKTSGAAVGRNIYQHSPEQGIKLAKAIAGLIYENYSLEQALTKLI
jgi:DhnA family fructose-bisphosphate aldolase class Ia